MLVHVKMVYNFPNEHRVRRSRNARQIYMYIIYNPNKVKRGLNLASAGAKFAQHDSSLCYKIYLTVSYNMLHAAQRALGGLQKHLTA